MNKFLFLLDIPELMSDSNNTLTLYFEGNLRYSDLYLKEIFSILDYLSNLFDFQYEKIDAINDSLEEKKRDKFAFFNLYFKKRDSVFYFEDFVKSNKSVSNFFFASFKDRLEKLSLVNCIGILLFERYDFPNSKKLSPLIKSKSLFSLKSESYRFNFMSDDPIIKDFCFNELDVEGRVSLKNPERIFDVFSFPSLNRGDFLFFERIFTKKRTQIKLGQIPGFLPIITDPTLSHCLFNLSEIEDDSVIVDPFVGIGGFFINNPYNEHVKYLNDIHELSLFNLKKNLDFFGVGNYKITKEDGLNYSRFILKEVFDSKYFSSRVKELSSKNPLFSAKDFIKSKIRVITDIPYGKNSILSKEISEFFECFLEDALKYSKKVSVILPLTNKTGFDFYKSRLDSFNMKIKYSHEIYINKSLSKLLMVLEI